jgi:hypothetical protein
VQDHRTAGRAAADVPRQTEAEREDSSDTGRRFARALARSVFGRHYWDDRLEAEMRRQLRVSKERLKR